METAFSAYGFAGGSPGDPSVKGETSVGVSLDIPKGAGPGLPMHWGNPLFWLLIGILVFTGWIFGGFSVSAGGGIKRVGRAGGSARIKSGR